MMPIMVIRYGPPADFIVYDGLGLLQPLTEAKAAMLALTQMPYQRSWADKLQELQLKREVAGTSRIEGAEFTEKELDAALRETPQQLATRSQRQAAAAVATYRWIAKLPPGKPVDLALLLEVHARLVTGCDDDHCPPGKLRGADHNVTFGQPKHRGVEGGAPCRTAVTNLLRAVGSNFREHDPLIQALALHYQFAAMHPFLDGNGRTARALEALMLQRVGLRDTLFIAMSNFYYEEKAAYLQALADTRARGHDLTPFLRFALRGIEIQCGRLLAEIREQVSKALFRNTMADLFGRLKSPRKRVMSARHMKLLSLLLDEGPQLLGQLGLRTAHFYLVKNPLKALLRDISYLLELGAIEAGPGSSSGLRANLSWPTEITETEFFKRTAAFPKGKLHGFLSR